MQKSCLGKNYSFEIERKKKDYYYVNHYSVAKEEAKAKNRSHAELSSLSETKAKPWEREGKKRSVTCMNFKEREREKNARKHVKKGPRARMKEKREREKRTKTVAFEKETRNVLPRAVEVFTVSQQLQRKYA